MGPIETAAKSVLCKPYFKKTEARADLASLSHVFSQLNLTAILGGNNAVERFSYFTAEPVEVFEFKISQDNPFEKLQSVLNKYKLDENCHIDSPDGIFTGGWIGYFSYELGRYIEKIPETTTDDINMPLIRLCFYDKVIAYDHKNKNFRLIALELETDTETIEQKIDWLRKLLDSAGEINVPTPAKADLDNIDLGQFNCNLDKDYYFNSIEKIKHYIFDGDVYQINFSQRFDCDFAADAINLFHWQNHYNPSGFAAYIDTGDFKIVSASPEMFVTIGDGIISTKPIKGTRRRTNDKQTDEKNYKELINSPKEQAELNMIVDLERNDLARICKAGTRKVTQRRTIETYPTVFHAVATVSGELKKQITFCDILKAIFPGGSITGAPKVAAMEIIDETEPTARGVYTGSIGLLGLNGDACLNIAIRTIIISGGKAYAQTGGGIVADSNAKDEWNETITKARALLAGIKAVK
ncbi:MAG: anthranilate synthase component I family protein [Planctomycetes bacterium]|nr:anthranilate synthase component I family protein [Planctomycetota bacterium]